MGERPISQMIISAGIWSLIVLGIILAFGPPVLFGLLLIAAMMFSSPPFAAVVGLVAGFSLILFVVRLINRQGVKHRAPKKG
jgi:hypothetical protein